MRIHAEIGNDGQQNRGGDENQRRHVHDHSQPQENDIDDHKNHIAIIGQRNERFGDNARNIKPRHHVTVSAGGRDQSGYNGDGFQGFK